MVKIFTISDFKISLQDKKFRNAYALRNFFCEI